MPKITDYTVITSLDPTDSLIDVSIDVAGTPLTRAISPEDLASSLNIGQGSFYEVNGFITDPVRTVDMNANSLYFAKARVGVGAIPALGSETFVVSQASGGEAVARFSNVGDADNYLIITDSGQTQLGDISNISNVRLVNFGRADFITDSTNNESYRFQGASGSSNTSVIINVGTVTESEILLGTEFSIKNDEGVNSFIESSNDIIIKGNNNGFVLESPDTTLWRITIDNSGVLQTTTV